MRRVLVKDDLLSILLWLMVPQSRSLTTLSQPIKLLLLVLKNLVSQWLG